MNNILYKYKVIHYNKSIKLITTHLMEDIKMASNVAILKSKWARLQQQKNLIVYGSLVLR